MVKLVAVGRAIEAVYHIELRLFGKRALGENLDKLAKVALGGGKILKLIVAHTPVEAHGVLLGSTLGVHSHVFEQLRSLGIFAIFIKFEGGTVLLAIVMAFQQLFEFRRAAGSQCHSNQQNEYQEFLLHISFKYFSASIAALQPLPAATTA